LVGVDDWFLNILFFNHANHRRQTKTVIHADFKPKRKKVILAPKMNHPADKIHSFCLHHKL
jgi:hypothetical protein